MGVQGEEVVGYGFELWGEELVEGEVWVWGEVKERAWCGCVQEVRWLWEG